MKLLSIDMTGFFSRIAGYRYTLRAPGQAPREWVTFTSKNREKGLDLARVKARAFLAAHHAVPCIRIDAYGLCGWCGGSGVDPRDYHTCNRCDGQCSLGKSDTEQVYQTGAQ